MANANANRGDLGDAATLAPVDPDANTSGLPPSGHTETGERGNQPILQVAYETSDVPVSLPQVEHDIGNSLSGSMVGVLTTATGRVDRKTVRYQEVGSCGAGSGGIERGVLDQPDEVAGLTRPDVGDPTLHLGHGVPIGDGGLADLPLDAAHGRDFITPLP